MEINEILAIAMFITFIGLLFTGYPVAWVLGGVAVLFTGIATILDTYFDTFIGLDWGYSSIVVARIWDTMNSWVLVAIPVFIFMGLMLDRSGLAEDLIDNLSKLMGRLKGGMAITICLVGLLLAASTGIIGASVVLLAMIGMPLMMRDNYSPELACGVVCATGCLGILIPPSIMLVIMGDRIGVPVGDLFLGAVIPGLLLGAMYIIYIILLGVFSPKQVPASKHAAPVTMKVVWDVIKAVALPACLMFSVLGSIFFGIASPTEASGVGAFGAMLLALFKGKLNLKVLGETTKQTMRTSSFIFALFVGATAFSLVLRGLGGDDLIKNAFEGLPFGPNGIIICILLCTFLLGFVLDWIEITLIILPLVSPIVEGLGFSIVWFVILFAVCLQTSFITPPVGFALFYMKGVAPKGITVGTIYKGVVPFILLQLIGLTLVFLFPALVTWLPSMGMY